MIGGLKLREKEKTRFFFFVSVNGLMNIGLTIGQSVSEGLFLSNPALGPSRLPQLFIFTALATALTTFLYAFYVDKLRNDTYFQIIHVYTVGLLCLILVGVHYQLTLPIMLYFGFFYVATGIFNTHFWNYAADYFDAVEAKRLFPYFPLGNSIGGFIGGLITDRLAETVSAVVLSVGWVLMLLATWFLIKIVSPRLKGWVVMEVEEADEASLGNLRQGFNFLRRSPMGRWHFAYAGSMIMCLFFLQYLYSDIFARTYPNTEELTAFIGRFLAITNVVEVVLELTFTSYLIGWAGVGSANLFYPLSTLLGFCWIRMPHPKPLYAAIYSRMNRETFENAVSGSCRNLLYNAYPMRFRGRIRAFLEGVVSNVGSVTAGILLMLITALLPPQHVFEFVTYFGMALTGGFLTVALVLRHRYFSALVTGLKEWHLDLDDASLELDKVTDEEIFEVLSTLSANDDPDSMQLVGKMFVLLLKRGQTEVVLERLNTASECVATVALEALAQVSDERVVSHLERLLKEGSPPLRARALELMQAYRPLKDIASYLYDNEPTVAAVAASLITRSGTPEQRTEAWKFLRGLLDDPQARVRAHALSVLPLEEPQGRQLFLQQVGDSDPAVMRVMLDRLNNLNAAAQPPEGFDDLRTLLSTPSPELRGAALRLLGRSKDARWIPVIAMHLQEESFLARRAAVEALQGWGMLAFEEARRHLDSFSPDAVDAALSTLSVLDHEQARSAIFSFMDRLVRQANELIVYQAVMEEAVGSAPDTPPLIAMADFGKRANNHIFNALASLENAQVITNIRRCLSTNNRQARGDALEALSHLGNRRLMQGTVTLLDESPVAERMSSALQYLERDKPPSWIEVQRQLLTHSDRWVRAGCQYQALANHWETKGAPIDQAEEVESMKNLLFLKRVPLFSQMSLEQLEIISRIVTELSFLKDEVIFKEGEIGDELYVIQSGKVAIVKNHRTPHEVLLATLKDTDYFGEMAVLDNDTRSATVVVLEDSRLLSISGEKLHDIILQKPEIAFEIFKMLTSRLRRTDQRLAELSRELADLKKRVEPAEPVTA